MDSRSVVSTLCNLVAPLSTEISRQDYWSRLQFPPPGDLPDPGVSCFAAKFFSSEPEGKSSKPQVVVHITDARQPKSQNQATLNRYATDACYPLSGRKQRRTGKHTPRNAAPTSAPLFKHSTALPTLPQHTLKSDPPTSSPCSQSTEAGGQRWEYGKISGKEDTRLTGPKGPRGTRRRQRSQVANCCCCCS